MTIHLGLLPPHITTLWVVISAFAGANLADIVQPYVSVTDPGCGLELCRYMLDEKPVQDKRAHTAVVLGRIFRKGAAWEVQALGRMCQGEAGDYDPILKCIKELQ
jgi:stress response protein SCP2